MKRVFLSLCFLPAVIFAQYFNERSTEQNFETNDFYFNRYAFNPYGMINFKDITPGLIDNPFLNIFLNPSRITNLNDKFYFYLDYRGERTTRPEIFDYPLPLPLFLDSPTMIYPSPIFIAQSRIEPEPKFSIGVITNPFNSLKDKLFFGATFQRIHKAEKFYSMPYWLYFPLTGRDPFGTRFAMDFPVPVIDRYYGRDEMITQANLYSFFAGYKINEKLSAGVQFSGINHSREGGIQNRYNDDYGNIDNVISNSNYLIERTRDYNHYDYTAGLTYSEEKTKIGFKLGLLKGKANQNEQNINYYFYQYRQPEISSEWSLNENNYNLIQAWNNEGKIYYGGIDFTHYLNDEIQFFAFINYQKGNIDFVNSSSLRDSNYYNTKFNYNSDNNTYWAKSLNSYLLKDLRTGSGTKKKSDYSGMIGLRWKLSPKIKLTFGLAYFEQNLNIKSIEPVIYEAVSRYDYYTNNPNNYNYPSSTSYLRVYEDKELEWNYNSINFYYFIPVVFDFTISEKFEFSILVNQISGGTKINDETIAYLKTRIRTENDSTVQKNNFIERYLNPSTNITFEKTDLICKVKFNLHPNLSMSFLFNPEVEPLPNINQFWFAIEGKF
jgi:hypothetical protein